jgi:hypothetical protein
MAGKNIAVFGIFIGREQGERAAQSLTESGFAKEDILVSSGAEITENEAKRFKGRIHPGNALLSVLCSSRVSVARAESLLKHAGAQDTASNGEGVMTG